MYNCMFVGALPDPTCNSEKSANGGNKQILLLLSLLLLLKHIFLAFFAKNQKIEKLPIFDQKHELTALEKSQFFDFLNFLLL